MVTGVDITYDSNIEMTKLLWILLAGAVALTFILIVLIHRRKGSKKII